MTLQRVQCGLVTVTAALFSIVNLVSGEYRVAVFSFACGAVWLLLERVGKRRSGTLFFVALAGVAILGVLSHHSIPIMVFGLSTNLAAWDLSRLLARVSLAPRNDRTAGLVQRHLRLLLVTVGAGLVLTLPAFVVRIPMNFVVFFVFVVSMMLVLRKALVYLRPA